MIPVNRPTFNGNELNYLSDALSTGWISSESPYVDLFERKFAKYFNKSFATTVSNGTVALELAVRALELNPEDEIILPSFSIISCVLAVIRGGAKPVLADIDPVTWNIDCSSIEKKITNKTKALLIVHTYGLPCDMDKIQEICMKYNLKLIEDNAEGIGLTYKNRTCGSFGDISITSLYANKHVTSGEGGLIFSNVEEYISKVNYWKNLSFDKASRFVHRELGWNYRMTGLQAAVGLAQLERIDWTIARKKYIGNLYNGILSNCKIIQLPLQKTLEFENIYWVYGVVLKNNSIDFRNFIMNELRKMGIESRPFFWPTHLQPALNKLGYFLNESYPVTETVAYSGFYLPSGTGNTDLEIEKSAESLLKILGEK
jgi:perosamine synthetase